MKLRFNSTDEINEFLLKDMILLDYCKKIITHIKYQITDYLNGDSPRNEFNLMDFFADIRGVIFLKNHTCIEWSPDIPLTNLVFPDIDDIVYVHFRTMPLILTEKQKRIRTVWSVLF